MRHLFNPQRVLMISLLFLSALFSLTSCGDDESKDTVIDYYVNVEAEFLIDGSTIHVNQFYSPITRMMEAIRRVYPTPNASGNDDAVREACNQEYLAYKEMYEGLPDHITCIFTVMKVNKVGYVVKKSEPFAYYLYDINPPSPAD